MEIPHFVPHFFVGGFGGLKEISKVVTRQSVACCKEGQKTKFRVELHDLFFPNLSLCRLKLGGMAPLVSNLDT